MKHIEYILILLLGLIFPIKVYAEYTYIPMLEDGKKWVIANYSLDNPSEYYILYTIIVGKDTVAEEHEAKIIEYDYDGRYQNKFNISYEDNKSLYQYFPPTVSRCPGFKEILNFNVHVGDTIGDYIVRLDDMITIRGVTRRVLGLIEYYPEVPDPDNPDFKKYMYSTKFPSILWVEGIGALIDYYLNNWVRAFSTGLKILECYMNDELIYKDGDIEAILGVDNIMLNDGIKQDVSLYDVMGQRVDKPRKGQIYIRGGKKIIW